MSGALFFALLVILAEGIQRIAPMHAGTGFRLSPE